MLKREEREVKLRKVRNKQKWIDKTNCIEIQYNPFFEQYDARTTKPGRMCFAFGKTLEEAVGNVKNDFRFWL